MRKLLLSDVDEMEKILNALWVHHRHACCLIIIGTALKAIGCTPDYDDFNEVHSKQGELITANSRQSMINTEKQEQINNLTRTVNLLLRRTKERDLDTENVYDLLNSEQSSF